MAPRPNPNGIAKTGHEGVIRNRARNVGQRRWGEYFATGRIEVIRAFFKALAQLGDPAIRRLVRISIFAAIGVMFLLWAGIVYLLGATALFQ